MFWWIVGIIVVVGLVWMLMTRRGSTGASRNDDLPSGGDQRPPGSGFTPGV